jgi:3-hydroxyisobutyrate dehydrogenase
VDVGFIGLGTMGLPVARNIVRAGTDLVVWNRSEPACDVMRAAGARVAETPRQVFTESQVIFVMLANGEVIDAVLERGTPRFGELVGGRTVVHMGTTAASYSHQLATDTASAGGRYVEAPVSGSRVPAEAGQLVGMIAGPDDAVDLVLPLLQPVCSSVVRCGAVPKATQMKLAVNLFLITEVAGLVEAFHFAEGNGLDLELFRSVVDAGPMASAVSRLKLGKLVSGDFTVQASISDVFYNNRLIADAARGAQVSTPLLDTCHQLFREAERLGYGHEDMAAVLRAFEALTGTPSTEPTSPPRRPDQPGASVDRDPRQEQSG